VRELVFLDAVDLAARIRARDVSATEVLDAHLAQIERVNPAVNAIVTLIPEQAREAARAADSALARGERVGPLHGLPIAHKDTTITKGIRTTFGSPIYRDHVPDQNALIIERLHAAGAIPIGKTNVPEFGAGSHSFNPIFGATRNPYDLSKTAGGSSGGAAAALACGMHPIADGSDLGGSLRNPGNFNNVVGFRPSPGRVPSWPSRSGWFPLSVHGPLARTVSDVALMLSAIAGPDRRSPIAIEQPAAIFARPLARDFKGVRMAWSPTLGGLPVDPLVTATLEKQRQVFADLGCIIEEASPDFSGANEVFQTLRAWTFEHGYGDLMDQHRDQMKATVIWNIEQGRRLSGPDLARAEGLRTEIFERVRLFFETYEFLLAPVNQVPPFDLTTEYPTSINGVQMETYIDWMQSCSFITVTGHPAISVPAGFTDDGLPVGLQVVGRHHDDVGVLQLAYAFERATQFNSVRPPVVTQPSATPEAGGYRVPSPRA
jgi:amidase